MKHLLDINVLLAAIWTGHPHHDRVFSWLGDKSVSVCPLTELGFLRISTQPKVFNVAMDKARHALDTFLRERGADRLADDLPALDSHPQNSAQVTDAYLAALAGKHGHKLATLDGGITHPAAELVP